MIGSIVVALIFCFPIKRLHKCKKNELIDSVNSKIEKPTHLHVFVIMDSLKRSFTKDLYDSLRAPNQEYHKIFPFDSLNDSDKNNLINLLKRFPDTILIAENSLFPKDLSDTIKTGYKKVYFYLDTNSNNKIISTSIMYYQVESLKLGTLGKFDYKPALTRIILPLKFEQLLLKSTEDVGIFKNLLYGYESHMNRNYSNVIKYNEKLIYIIDTLSSNNKSSMLHNKQGLKDSLLGFANLQIARSCMAFYSNPKYHEYSYQDSCEKYLEVADKLFKKKNPKVIAFKSILYFDKIGWNRLDNLIRDYYRVDLTNDNEEQLLIYIGYFVKMAENYEKIHIDSETKKDSIEIKNLLGSVDVYYNKYKLAISEITK